jgi:2-methylcitrate dehydratase PrpD
VKQVDIPKGDPRDPMTEKDIIDKVKTYSGVRDQNKIGEVISLILNLENITDIRSLLIMV